MKPYIIVRYNEIAIKGKNRSTFEKMLAANILDVSKANGINALIERKNTRIFVHIPQLLYDTKPQEPFKNVFGISSFSYALQVPNSIEALQDIIRTLLAQKNLTGKSFRVSSRNVGNVRAADSLDYNKQVGSFIADLTGMRVSLKEFDIEIGIEIMDDICYVFDNRINGYGGLPLGVSGTVYCLIENTRSALAAWLMMKRGCYVIGVGIKKQTQELITSLKKFNSYQALPIIAPEAIPKDAAIVTGETLTDTALHQYGQAIVLRPLVGKSKLEIENLLKILQ